MTRLYPSASGVKTTPVTIRGAWEKTAGHAVCSLGAKDLSGLGGPVSIGVAETVATADYDVLLLRCVSAPLAADHNFSGTLDLVMGVQEASSSDADMAFYLHIFVTQGDTDNLRGTLLANYADPNTNEWGTTALGKSLSAVATLTAVSALAGDRIVIEIGYRARNTTTNSRTGTIWYGGSGSDLTVGGAATGGVGYFDFSDTFTLAENPVLRVSQLAVEALRRPTQARVQVSQLAIETVRRTSDANLRLSQIAVEVVRSNGSPPSSGQGGMLIVVAG